MKYEHFELVCDHFNLTKFNELNSITAWSEDFEGAVDISKLHLQNQADGVYIRAPRGASYTYLFVCIPTLQLAEEIVQYIRDTEVLFI